MMKIVAAQLLGSVALCLMLVLASPTSAAVLSDDQMLLLQGGGVHNCGVYYGHCENTEESLDNKAVGEDCWKCNHGDRQYVGCSVTQRHLRCGAHQMDAWCGQRQLGMVNTHEADNGGQYHLYCDTAGGALTLGCPGIGGATNMCRK